MFCASRATNYGALDSILILDSICVRWWWLDVRCPTLHRRKRKPAANNKQKQRAHDCDSHPVSTLRCVYAATTIINIGLPPWDRWGQSGQRFIQIVSFRDLIVCAQRAFAPPRVREPYFSIRRRFFVMFRCLKILLGMDWEACAYHTHTHTLRIDKIIYIASVTIIKSKSASNTFGSNSSFIHFACRDFSAPDRSSRNITRKKKTRKYTHTH